MSGPSFGKASGAQTDSTLRSGDLDLDSAVDNILNYADRLTQIQLNDILVICEQHYGAGEGKVLTLTEELEANKRIIRALRNEFFNPNGTRKDKGGTSIRELKEVLTTMASLESVIVKSEAQAFSQERQRQLEKCLVAAMKEIPEDQQEKFFSKLEDQLITLQED